MVLTPDTEIEIVENMHCTGLENEAYKKMENIELRTFWMCKSANPHGRGLNSHYFSSSPQNQ